jgi:hypothetical protein
MTAQRRRGRPGKARRASGPSGGPVRHGDIEPAQIGSILISARDMPAEEAVAGVAVECSPEGAATGYEAVAGLEVVALGQVTHLVSSSSTRKFPRSPGTTLRPGRGSLLEAGRGTRLCHFAASFRLARSLAAASPSLTHRCTNHKNREPDSELRTGPQPYGS